jgi:hypothetical protein
MQCTATVYKTGQQCKRRAVTGYKVCQVHGGKTPRGVASPHYKTGRYSKVLPARLAARYIESQADPRLLELRDDISLLDARLEDLLARVDTGESGALWGKLLTAKTELASISGTSAEATLKRQALMGYILDLITKGHADHQAWRELGGVLEQRRKLVESERKRLVEMQQVVTSERMVILIGQMVTIIKEHVHDRGILQAISGSIYALAEAEHTT